MNVVSGIVNRDIGRPKPGRMVDSESLTEQRNEIAFEKAKRAK